MRVTDGLYVMSQKEGGHVHAYMVEDEDGLTLVDTLYDSDAHVILDELHTYGKVPADIKRIALSHSHKSHISGLSTIAALSGAPVYAHEWEIPIIEGHRKAEKVGYRFPKPFNAEVYKLQIGLNLGLGRHTPRKVDQRISEGDRIGPLQCISVPGHTPGCIAFWWQEKGILLTGDTVSTWPVFPEISWPTFDLDHKQAQRSVAKMAELSTVQMVCVGHGSPIMSGALDTLKSLSSIPVL